MQRGRQRAATIALARLSMETKSGKGQGGLRFTGFRWAIACSARPRAEVAAASPAGPMGGVVGGCRSRVTGRTRAGFAQELLRRKTKESN